MLAKEQVPINQLGLQHHNSCECALCKKQQEIDFLNKHRINLHFKTKYQNDFVGKALKTKRKKQRMQNSEDKRKQQRNNYKSIDAPRSNSVQYLDLKSTYGMDFVDKKSEISKSRPLDNLGGYSSALPTSTTYMLSYKSSQTPKPEEPFKVIEMQVGMNAIPFSSSSAYQKAYRPNHNPKPTLPIVCRPGLGMPKSIGVFESIQKQSYSTINPENLENKDKFILKPTNNLTILAGSSHAYETTYRNFFVEGGKKIASKHSIDQIGNINTISRRRRSFLI